MLLEHVYSYKDNTTDGRQTMYSRATRDGKSNKTLKTLQYITFKQRPYITVHIENLPFPFYVT